MAVPKGATDRSEKHCDHRREHRHRREHHRRREHRHRRDL